MPAPHSVFYRPDALPAAQPTASTNSALILYWQESRPSCSATQQQFCTITCKGSICLYAHHATVTGHGWLSRGIHAWQHLLATYHFTAAKRGEVVPTGTLNKAKSITIYINSRKRYARTIRVSSGKRWSIARRFVSSGLRVISASNFCASFARICAKHGTSGRQCRCMPRQKHGFRPAETEHANLNFLISKQYTAIF